MKKYIILFLLVFLVTGCDSSSNNSNDSNKDSNVNDENNSQEKVEELLENNDFHCKDDICIKEYTDSCYAFKTRMIELKQNFADLLALADVEIEDLI